MTREKNEIIRMKNFRDMHKQREKILVAKIHTLRIDKTFLEKKIHKFKLKKSRFQMNFETKNYEYREILFREISVARRNEFFDINKNDFQFFRHDLTSNALKINRLNTIFQKIFDIVFIDVFFFDHRQMSYEKSKNIKDFYDDHDE